MCLLIISLGKDGVNTNRLGQFLDLHQKLAGGVCDPFANLDLAESGVFSVMERVQEDYLLKAK